jgi:hypothetical protein
MLIAKSEAAPGRTNQDFYVATDSCAVVVDGAGIGTGGCRHGVTWYAQMLGVMVFKHALNLDTDLSSALARGIEELANAHRDTCDLNDPLTPCAAVAVARLQESHVDVLCLSDTFVAVRGAGQVTEITDLAVDRVTTPEADAVAGLKIGSPEQRAAMDSLVAAQTATRNRVGGWWVAAADPEAAMHAVTGRFNLSDVSAVGIFSDGAARPVHLMQQRTWDEYLKLIAAMGPDHAFRELRTIERADAEGLLYPRPKVHDDSTVVLWELGPA